LVMYLFLRKVVADNIKASYMSVEILKKIRPYVLNMLNMIICMLI